MERRSFRLFGIVSSAERVEVEENLLFHALPSTLVKDFEVNRLNQGIRCVLLVMAEYLEDFRFYGIVQSRSFPTEEFCQSAVFGE
jgi:hypothetical protein